MIEPPIESQELNAARQAIELLRIAHNREVADNARLWEHLRRIEELARNPANPGVDPNAWDWVANECLKARTIECEVCHGIGSVESDLT